MDWKNMFSALLGFSAVIFLELPQSGFLTRGGQSKYVPLFIIVLISQVLLEIFAKYQGKMCETIEGLFTATIAVLGYLVAMAVANRTVQAGWGRQSGGQYGAPAAGYQASYSYSGPGIGGGVLMAAVVVGLFLFIWKAWLRPRLGIHIQGCNPQGGPQQVVVQQPVQQVPPEQQQQQQVAQQVAEGYY